MSLAGIEQYRRQVTRLVREERRLYEQPIGEGVDIDVSMFDGIYGESSAYGDDRDHHRRVACEARAELWKHIRAGELHPDDQVQTFEEMSHTE